MLYLKLKNFQILSKLGKYAMISIVAYLIFLGESLVENIISRNDQILGDIELFTFDISTLVRLL